MAEDVTMDGLRSCQREGRVPLAKRGRLVKGAVIGTPNAVAEDVTMDGLRSCQREGRVPLAKRGRLVKEQCSNSECRPEKGTKIGFSTVGARRLPSGQFFGLRDVAASTGDRCCGQRVVILTRMSRLQENSGELQ